MQSFTRTEQQAGVTYEGYENRLLHKYNDFIAKSGFKVNRSGCLVTPDVFAFHEIDKCFIHYFVAPGCGVIAGEVPIAGVGRTSAVQ